MASSVFGWDLLYKSVENDIKTNQDILICLVHLVLVSNDFKCIGLGESKNLDGTETRSEALPSGWNQNYAIRYVYQGRLYNLKATPLDDGIMVNLIRVDERNVSLVQLNTRSVASRTGSLEQMIPDHSNIVDMIKKQLIEKVTVSKKSKDISSQTEPGRSDEDRYGFGNPESRRSEPSAGHFPGIGRSLIDPIGGGVGSRDLDPFAGQNPLRLPGRGGGGGFFQPPGGGGMLFQPPSGPNFPGGPNIGMPPGSIPPGARFDPFRPPDVDRFPRRPGNPDNDEFPPPGYDDMFM